MATNKTAWYWLLGSVILVVIIIIGGLVVWLRYNPGRPLEISLPSRLTHQGTIYLGGAVVSPGLYPFTGGDSLETLFRAAGGTTDSANLSDLKLYITPVGDAGPQRIDINRAEVWLLEALPGIGETLAQRIIDHRQQNGPFRSTVELLKVSGMGTKTYEQIKDLVTVGDILR